MPICSMNVGRCPNEAIYRLQTTGKPVSFIDLRADFRIRERVTRIRTMFSCEKHLRALESCADLYGGDVETITK